MQLFWQHSKKKNVKAKRIILDAIKDHVIPHVAGKANAFEMWASLTKLYQSSNENQKDGIEREAEKHKDDRD
jgi:hypothetical protein